MVRGSWVRRSLSALFGAFLVVVLGASYSFAADYEWVGAPVVVTSTGAYSPYVASNAWDQDDATIWNTGDVGAAWSAADFGSPVTVSRVRLKSNSSGGTWDLQGSTDGSSWTTIQAGLTIDSGGVVHDLASPVTYQHFRIYRASGAWNDPSSVDLFSEVVPTPTPTPEPTASDGNVYVTFPDDLTSTATLTPDQFDTLLWVGGALVALTLVGVVGSWAR